MIRQDVNCGKKKSQFKIQQMSFMLVAVVLFFILVFLFYISLQYRNLREQATQLEEEKAFVMAEFLADSSEFNCANENYCIDTDKIIVLMNKTAYKELWSSIAYIYIRKLSGEKEKACNKANYPECNIFKVYDNKKIKSKSSEGSFIALCRYEQIEGYLIRVCELGKLIIGYEVK